VPILALLDYAYIEDHSLAYYSVYERVIILWYYATDYTVQSSVYFHPAGTLRKTATKRWREWDRGS